MKITFKLSIVPLYFLLNRIIGKPPFVFLGHLD